MSSHPSQFRDRHHKQDIGSNGNTVHARHGRSFVPPAARRKGFARIKHRRQNTMVNVILLIILVGFIVGFVGWNIKYTRKVRSSKMNLESLIDQPIEITQHVRGSWVSPKSQPFNQNGNAHNAHHLIVVAGHSVTISGHLEDAGHDEADWYLLDYQKGSGLPQAIEGHIRTGLDAANADEDSLLIFSGGETRSAAGPLTEGSSYFHVTDAMQMWPQGSTVRSRTITEEFATDSFENLLFSICRFHEVTGRYPTKITVVSFSYKQRRFQTLHAPALQWPSHQFDYIGVDPSLSTGFDLNAASEGENMNAAKPFEGDPYGCSSPVLQQKRKDRNPFYRTPPYSISCPDMTELLKWCGPELIPKDKVPWGSRQ